MKKLLFAISVIVVSLMAVDYSQMSMEELNALRGTLTPEERNAFRAEMQKRVQLMSPEERAAFIEERRAKKGSGFNALHKASSGQTQGIQQRLRDGSGAV